MVKKTEEKTTYYFVDESGDPIFYNRYGELIVGQGGCSKILLVGFIRTTDPRPIRQALSDLRYEIANDPYLRGIPSLKSSVEYFHAKNDSPEVRERVFKKIVSLDFKAEFIVARKIESIFTKRHNRRENVFYDDLLAKLFENKLHTSAENKIYYAVRGNRIRQEPISSAIQTAILTFEKKWDTKINSTIEVQAQTMTGEPCLQLADYMNWAMQRTFLKGDMRYFNFVKDKISYVADVYDFDRYPKNYYGSKNLFDANKISPL
ncbi:MAG: hypothetical protein A3C02_01130 [Candidatus Andersenbacteria bacterium RIFCSPHIGHO2_02_FULL_45_11]|uniref:DUF3800 domain-containing protein n=1 Tax=Candidatus Andersenbacteria bacterium RIFCSPHIGHO2_12_FULL_45_11 TaxID=1797281 RepID=A0A1G1X1K6_9BACT|nr:MAG: hypothetical protein A2805_04130 [Candidatus Andersenbacteria bacterium RIFCSPHIGHO2_01_FULL_46_36]OGY33585.1 MAG: hypothetical protein A3C02_01130 [Candidatus Andersenbacteria bacterium RIFCSPHIGHO2_02_FULL_45_11]OGY33853.1 MAG: hypothetical protein A3D99_03910 [Candidatus Andersenbacteria bacterium RIFCSPHIGHO2_12_FULL_45_11]